MSRWSDRTKALVLFGLGLLVYGFGIGHEFYFDDLAYISQNPLLQRHDAFRVFWFTSEAFNYYPLFWSLLRVQWLLWGNNPGGYQLVTLLAHCLNGVLLWRIALKCRLPGAWWIGALFVVHPINVQTVAWAAEQKNTWSFLFMALTVLAYIKYVELNGWRSYALALGCFVASLACKTSTVCLPIFLVLCDGFDRQKSWRRLLGLIPFFTAAGVAGITTMWFEQNRVGAKSLISELGLWQRLEMAGATFWVYLEKAILPVQLSPMYRGWVDATAVAHTALPLFLLVVMLILCALTWRRIGAPIAFGVAFYFVMLLPLLGLFDTRYFIYSLVADHWQYHALPGLLVAVVSASSMVAPKFASLMRYRQALATVAVTGLAILASIHLAHFDSARSLWTYTVRQNPDAWIAWYNLGNDHADGGEYAEAIADYRASLRAKPDSYSTHFNLANTLSTTNQLEEADREYCEARNISPEAPDNYVNRGVLLLRMQRQTEAVEEFLCALELDPQESSAQINLIAVYLRTGRVNDAFSYLHAAPLRDARNSRRVAEAIIACLAQQGNPGDVLEQFAARACNLSAGQRDLRAALGLVRNQRSN